MQIIMSSADRVRYGFTQGLYEVCIYGYLDSTVALTPTEVNTGGRYSANDGMVHTFNVPGLTGLYFTYTNKLLTQAQQISVNLTGLNLNTTANQAPPRVYYKVCSSNLVSQCALTPQERTGNATTMFEIGQGYSSG